MTGGGHTRENGELGEVHVMWWYSLSFFFLSSLKEIQKSDFLKVPRGILRLKICSRGWEVAIQGVCACVCKWRRLYPIFTPQTSAFIPCSLLQRILLNGK